MSQLSKDKGAVIANPKVASDEMENQEKISGVENTQKSGAGKVNISL